MPLSTVEVRHRPAVRNMLKQARKATSKAKRGTEALRESLVENDSLFCGLLDCVVASLDRVLLILGGLQDCIMRVNITAWIHDKRAVPEAYQHALRDVASARSELDSIGRTSNEYFQNHFRITFQTASWRYLRLLLRIRSVNNKNLKHLGTGNGTNDW
jgi:hypothetical protein